MNRIYALSVFFAASACWFVKLNIGQSQNRGNPKAYAGRPGKGSPWRHGPGQIGLGWAIHGYRHHQKRFLTIKSLHVVVSARSGAWVMPMHC
jgi:hypothetical protein